MQLLAAALVIFAANLRADSGANRREAALSSNIPPIVFVQTLRITGPTGVDRFPEGSRIALLEPNARNERARVLTEGFFASADPQISFTGERILFAGQKLRGDHWQIWEMNVHGSEARQITKCEMDCVRPVYLPGNEIAFTSVSTASGHKQSSLEVAQLDGANAHAITYGPGDWWMEAVLRDGRIVASANSPLADAQAGGNRLLYTMRPDGTGLESLRCEHALRADRGEASELEDGAIVFTENGGILMSVKKGALHGEKIDAPGSAYRSPSGLPNGAMVVARQAAIGQRYQLSVVEREGGGVRTIHADPKFDNVEPVALASRPVPKKFWSTLIPGSATGYFISLDTANSMDKALKPGTIRRVRVIERTASGEVVLGEAAVESDGSFYVQVPSNLPVRFVLLDERGTVIHEERSWIWTRPGEQRGCTGCHGDKALAPQNRWPVVLRKPDPPTRLGVAEGDTQTVESHGH